MNIEKDNPKLILELHDALRVSQILRTTRVGLKAPDNLEWRRLYGVRFCQALLGLQAAIRAREHRESVLINDLATQSLRDEWGAIKSAERTLETLTR